jgi:hypothetical protein
MPDARRVKRRNPGLYLVILTDIGQCVQAAGLPRRVAGYCGAGDRPAYCGAGGQG